MLAFRNLREISFDIENQDHNDYLLYSALTEVSDLETLSVVFEHMTSEGIRGLSSAITSSRNLKSIQLVQEKWGSDELQEQALKESELHRLVEAALSCPKVKDVDIGIPFATLAIGGNVSTSIERLAFDMPRNDCTKGSMCYIADMCSKLPFLKSLKMRISPEDAYRFMTVLNGTLHCNSSITQLTLLSHTPANHFSSLLGPMYPYCVRFLSRAVQKDPEITLCRSNSHQSQQSQLGCPSLVMRSQSSPDDPCGLQNMHPLLHKALGIGNGLHLQTDYLTN